MQQAPQCQGWLLRANIAEKQGLALVAQNKPDDAIETFQQAPADYHIIQSSVGINTTSLHLARAPFQPGELEKGRGSFDFAKAHIESQNIALLDSMLAACSERHQLFLYSKWRLFILECVVYKTTIESFSWR